MKRLQSLAILLFASLASLPCRAQTNITDFITTNAPANESWNSISNRWGSLPLAQTKKAAAQGDVRAEYYLGMTSLTENSPAKNQNEALKWLTSAANQGYAKAQMDLGFLYDRGNGVPQDQVLAAKFYRLAGDQGNARAQNDLGYLYYQGAGVPQDMIEAIKWYRRAAEQGDELGESNLGWMYAHGQGVERDYALAEKWMRAAAEQGSARLQFSYAEMLASEFDSNGHEAANFAVAAEWYRKAADQGHAKAMFELAELYNYGKLGDDQRSSCIPWYLKAAALGNTDAQAEIGELSKYYPNSELLKKTDVSTALQQSAASGKFEAQFQLAKRYQTGDGVPKDLNAAFKWMQQAAQNGTSSSEAGNAMYQLALMYENGEGVAPDEIQAHRLFLEAADDYATPEAIFRVGQMYEKGEGVPQDDGKAAAYYAAEYHNYVDTNNPDLRHPEKYADGMINYATTSDASVECLLSLWAAGRGFPAEKDKHIPGYKEPAALIQYFVGYIKTAKAQFCAGEIYYQGRIVSKDLAQAADWFNKAAIQGSPEAINRIGEMWAAGVNGTPDLKEAVKWYQKSAAKGLAAAQYNLGLCYATGNGISTNLITAWKWLDLAAGQKISGAAEQREKIQASMTADQLKTAQALANQFKTVGQP